MPGIFGTDLDSIPGGVPYISVADKSTQKWNEKLGNDGRLKVGINWQGNPKYVNDRYRSISLAAFAPLAAVEGVRLLSVQKDAGVEQLIDAPFAVEDFGSQLHESDRAFCETAAVLKNLDLFITSDTAVAHLAGAMGVPVWTALPFSPDWRWMLDRADCPWYPTMRLFRQSRPGDWAGVFQAMAEALAALRAEGAGAQARA